MNAYHQPRIAGVALATLLAASAHAQSVKLIADGNFESFSTQFPALTTAIDSTATGSTLDGWLVAGSGAELVQGGMGAINGVSLYLMGSLPSSVSQTLQATAGTTYTLNFDYASDSTGQPLSVLLGTSANLFAAPTGVTHETLSWTAQLDTPATLSFATLQPLSSGMTIDNVVLNASTAPVPEPTSEALLLAGLALMGLRNRWRFHAAQQQR